MARFQSIWLVAILTVSILMIHFSTEAATRAYIVNPEGLLLTLDADMDMVIGLREIPNLASEGRAGYGSQGSHVTQTSRIRDMSRTVEDEAEAMGRSLLTPQGDKLLVLDPLPYGLPHGFLVDEGPTGRVFVYDVVTGNKLGYVAFSVGAGDRLAAFHPRGDKAYVVSEGPRKDQMTITVISLTTLSVMKELVVPRGDFFVSQTAQ